MKKILNYLFEHKTLNREEAREVLKKITNAEYNEAEIAAFLTVYLMRSITTDELMGFRDALLELCKRVDLNGYETIDLCGTGGDNKNTFNISTTTAFVVAGAGYKVAKHGNYAVTSSSGSSNLLEYFGYKFSNDKDAIKKDLDKSNICFLHAPLFHPAMKNVAPIRKKLGVKTFFNMLGPMVNPAFPKYQVVGVFNLELARIFNYIYQQTDKKYAIVHSLDGYDEISLTGDFKIFGNYFEKIISPEQLGLKKHDFKEIEGGKSVEESAKIFVNVLEGKATTAQMNVVLANSAIAIQTIDNKKSMDECIDNAKESIQSGKGLKCFKKMIN